MRSSDGLRVAGKKVGIESRIYWVRDQKVMLDGDLAALYGVTTKRLNQAVRRNLRRFPSDFMFQLTLTETANLRSQIVTSSAAYGGRRYLPFVFTEQGVAMLSSVLHSERAIQVNIAIMRVFARLKESLLRHDDLAIKFKELQNRMDTQDAKILAIFNAIGELIDPRKPVPRIGFKTHKPV
jgi:hypothetical protein